MDKHKQTLNNLCRLCGSCIVEDGHYKAKQVLVYQEVIEENFNMSIINDSPDIHPMHICKKCYLKIYYFIKSKGKSDIKIDVFSFQEHVSKNCPVCEKSTVGRPKTETMFSNLISISRKNNLKLVHKLNSELKLKIHIQNLDIFLTVLADNSWYLTLSDGKMIPNSSNLVSSLPAEYTDKTAGEIVDKLKRAVVCPGNDDFPLLVASHIQNVKPFVSSNKEVVAHLETKDGKDLTDLKVIRHNKCSLLIDNIKKTWCEECSQYRKTLLVLENRLQQKDSDATVPLQTNNRYLSEEQKLRKLKALEQERKQLVSKIMRLQNKISKVIKKEGITLKDQDNKIVEEVIQKEKCPFKEDSPQYILWQQQQMQCSLSNKKSMKWHPLIVRWCISIYLKSPGAYKHMRSSPFISLPCKNTLLKYINFSDPGCGFSVDIIENLIKKIDLPNLSEKEKHVSLIFDEMKVKCGVVFSRSTGKLVGFNEMGSINDELELFQRRFTDSSSASSPRASSLASYVIVFMVRGLGSSLCYPMGHFASSGFTNNQIYHAAWDAIGILESIGLKVHAVISDGASPNRKFIKIHQLKNKENYANGILYWTWNEWCLERKLYFVCDVPHLLKTTRNNLENSGGNYKTRRLMLNNQEMGWHQIVKLYEWDLGSDRFAMGLRMGHKFKEEMIHLTPQSQMVVSYAAKILSMTTVHMLEEQDDPATTSLRYFIEKIDTFFDCLNVSKVLNTTRKPALDIYRSIDDYRFQWLEKEFLGFLDTWEAEIENVTDISESEKKKMCLSAQTLEGIRITVHSFVSLCKHLLSDCSFDYFMSEKLSQDPLEEYFSKQRFRGGCNDNPSLEEFNRNALALHVAGDELIRVTTGNTRGRCVDRPELDASDTNLPKIKRLKR